MSLGRIFDNINKEDRRDAADESSVDFPMPDMDSKIWDKTEDGYVLNTKAEDFIYSALKKYPEFDLVEAAYEIHLIGSLMTNQYTENADLDVHLLIDESKLPEGKTKEEWQDSIKDYYDNHRLFFGTHPVEVFYQLNKYQEYMAEGLYDLKNHKWLKGPGIVQPDFNPYSVYKEVADEIGTFVKDTDLLIAELKRDVIDYDVIKDAIEHAEPEVKEKLKGVLQAKLAEIEKDIDELYKDRKGWVDMRHNSTKSVDPEKALNDINFVKNWHDTNAIFKLLHRYQYIALIKELENMTDDKDLTDKDVNKIKNLMGIKQGGVHV